MALNSISSTVKRSLHSILAICGLEVIKENYNIKLRRRFYIGSNFLNDISKIIGGAKNVSVCIDGGAHHGETALILADAFSKATIYSFEPEKNNFLILSKNVSSCKRIIPVNAALGDISSSGSFVVNCSSQTGSLLAAAQGVEKYVSDSKALQPVTTETVSIEALSDWAKNNEIDSIDLLKMDLQGYELKALEGAKFLLTSKRILFIYLEVNFVPTYEGQASLTELYDYCTDLGYRLVGLYPNEFNAREFHYRCGGDLLFVLEDLKAFNKKGSACV